MIDRSKLNMVDGFHLHLKFEDILTVLKPLRLIYFNVNSTSSQMFKARSVHNNIVIQTGIGVVL